MIATVINALAVVSGSLVGLAFKGLIAKREDIQSIIYNAVGLISLVLGIIMSIRTQRILYFALAIVIGAIIGELLGIERGILRLGDVLHKFVPTRGGAGVCKARETSAESESGAKADSSAVDKAEQFPRAFLDSSVLFCVGSLAIVGAMQASIEGNYGVLLTKSVLDGTIAALLTATLGIGVGFSALSVLVYQGALHAAATVLAPYVSNLLLSEISAVGGIMIIGIGTSLLGIKKIPTGNFLPALVIIIILVFLDPLIPAFFKG